MGNDADVTRLQPWAWQVVQLARVRPYRVALSGVALGNSQNFYT